MPSSMPMLHRGCASHPKALRGNRTSNFQRIDCVGSEISTPQFVWHPVRYTSDAANRVLYVIYAALIVVIFKGSCPPLCSSPRTMGVIIADLVLLICG